LSNFYKAPFEANRSLYDSVEHYFQSSKAALPNDKEMLRTHPAKGLKQAARKVILRTDWESIKNRVMWEGLWLKFNTHKDLARRLIAMNEQIVEDNYWHDNYWGNCICPKCVKKPGINMVGFYLTELRKMLIRKYTY
jgi:ribA/ribD-fused uncharacterized protein